mmetsp:Transcript_7017/g.15969  ORF Transcript_7017/g.15969 Transcript_7017/m.15969 type:complete len:205 (+) Transcript_7017:3226-3840(+)
MEGCPVDAAIVSLQDIFHHDIIGAKQLSLYIQSSCRSRRLPPTTVAILSIHHSGESPIRSSGSPQLLFAQSSGVPHTHSLIQTGTNNKILRWMKGCTHDIMVVTRQHAQTTPLVKIPQSQRLIITRRQNPWKLRSIGMELHSSDVIQMTQQCKEASSKFIIPNLDFVIVAAGDDEGFVEMKVHTADGAVVLFEAVDDGAYAVVP